MELLGKKKAELKDLGNSQPNHTVKKKKNENAQWEENTSGVTNRPPDEEMSMNQPSQQKPRGLLQDNGRMTPRQFRNPQGCLLSFKVGNHGLFFKRLDGLHPQLCGQGHVEPWGLTPAQQFCGGRTATPVGPKRGTFTPGPVVQITESKRIILEL